ncbi:hypothetical protein ACFE04_014757 [Oxalis oulophora]
MDPDITYLSIRNDEEYGLELSNIEKVNQESPSYDTCLFGRFLTMSVINFQSMRSTLANGVEWGTLRLSIIIFSSLIVYVPMAIQLGNLLGSFIECDAKSIVRGATSFMRIRSKLMFISLCRVFVYCIKFLGVVLPTRLGVSNSLGANSSGLIRGNEDGIICYTSGVSNESNRRSLSFELLRQLSSINNMPWLCVGDYNDILTFDEKLSGVVRPCVFYEGFCSGVEDCGLEDIPYSGSLAGIRLTSKISLSVYRHVLCLFKNGRNRHIQAGAYLKQLEERLLRCHDTINTSEREELLGLEKENTKWHQRAKVHWLQHGDMNSKFFPHHASTRKRDNTISGLCKDDVTWTTNASEIQDITFQFS